MKPLILASASPRRREILTWAGVPFSVHPAPGEYAPADLPPAERVLALAKSKAQQVSVLYSNAIILGSDTMVAVDDTVLGKPRTPEEAVHMLMMLQGRSHQVYTGVWLVKTGEGGYTVKEDGFTDCTSVTFCPMTQQQAWDYVATGEPMDKAGAYGIQGRGMRYIEKIDGDFFTVMGLPGGRLLRFLDKFCSLHMDNFE